MAEASYVLSAEDRLAIQELTHRYSFFLDTYRFADFMELWTEDAVFDESPLGLPAANGRHAIRDFFRDNFGWSTGRVHYATNHIIEGTSPTEARGTCYALAESHLKSGTVVRIFGYYDDTYRKVDGLWRFSSRVVRPFITPEMGDLDARAGIDGGT